MRRHFSIGDGERVSLAKISPSKTTITRLRTGGSFAEDYWLGNEDSCAVTKKQDSEASDPSPSDMVPCTDESCSAEFLSFNQLYQHLQRGVHQLTQEKETMVDYVIKTSSLALDTYRSARNQVLLSAVRADQEETVDGDTEPVLLGWAIREPSRRNLDDKPAREYVQQYFRHRRGKGLKADPKEVLIMMKNEKKADGSSLFSPKNQLSLKQTKALIRTLLSKEKLQKNQPVVVLDDPGTDEDNISDDESAIRDVVDHNLNSLFDFDADDSVPSVQRVKIE